MYTHVFILVCTQVCLSEAVQKIICKIVSAISFGSSLYDEKRLQ